MTRHASSADPASYLGEVVHALRAPWPENRTVHIVCHGHSVPAGYFATPQVRALDAYPHLMRETLCGRFPHAAFNVIVTAVGGENSEAGAARFDREVLCHRPDVITIDYALNDRRLGLERAREAWRSMIETALDRGIKVLLLTPTPDVTLRRDSADEGRELLSHAAQVRDLAAQYSIGLVDSLDACMRHAGPDGLDEILSWVNHPNRAGHEIVAAELMKWFPERQG